MSTNVQLCLKIVINLVFKDDGNKILMIQEAKEHSRGLWFFPAGKGKEAELITDSCIRETLEESGIKTKPVNLLKIEHVVRRVFFDKDEEPKAIDIFRFIFVSDALDDNLKTNETKDSIQAKWIPIEEVKDLPLRSIEVLSYIDEYQNQKKRQHLANLSDILEAYND